MGFFRTILEKPWLNKNEPVIEFSTSYFATHNRKVALVIFLAIATVLFFLLVAATHMRLMMSTDWVSAPEPPLLWVNTGVIVLVSLVFEWCKSAIAKGDLKAGKLRLLGAGLLTLLFLILQLVVWQQLLALGYAAQSNPANAFFYVITAIHGVHLLGGLIAWGRTIARFGRGDGQAAIKLSVDLCALYWHVLLFVWVVLLGLFITT